MLVYARTADYIGIAASPAMSHRGQETLRHHNYLLIIHNPFLRLPCLLITPASFNFFIIFSAPRKLIPVSSATSTAVDDGLE